MSEMGDDFKALKEFNRKKKEQLITKAINVLNKMGVKFTNNDGFNIHLMLDVKNVRIDYWPSTGRWRVKGKSKFGLSPLCQFIRFIQNDSLGGEKHG